MKRRAYFASEAALTRFHSMLWRRRDLRIGIFRHDTDAWWQPYKARRPGFLITWEPRL